MMGFVIAAFSGLACAYLAGFIPGPRLPINEGAGFGLILVTGIITVAGIAAGVLDLIN